MGIQQDMTWDFGWSHWDRSLNRQHRILEGFEFESVEKLIQETWRKLANGESRGCLEHDLHGLK